jgi:hypothetical protein
VIIGIESSKLLLTKKSEVRKFINNQNIKKNSKSFQQFVKLIKKKSLLSDKKEAKLMAS